MTMKLTTKNRTTKKGWSGDYTLKTVQSGVVRIDEYSQNDKVNNTDVTVFPVDLLKNEEVRYEYTDLEDKDDQNKAFTSLRIYLPQGTLRVYLPYKARLV